jgi:TPP-dependent pyruvate/acetoin dehydrogenase alpha subunit
MVVDEGLIDADDLARIESEVEAELESAVEDAENAPLPDVASLYEDVYSQE